RPPTPTPFPYTTLFRSILDANGKLATSPLKVTIATVDLFSPDQMPGDGSVVPRTGGGAYLQSYGAGSLELPSGFKLKPGAVAGLDRKSTRLNSSHRTIS